MADELQGTMRLHRILQERDYQPEWRAMASRCHQYYDGNQLEPAIIDALTAKKLPILITNLIQPAVNGVLGMEARGRRDWFVQADDDEFTEVAEALNIRMNEGLRTAKANNACSEAYRGQIVGGIGWVEFKTNRDPLGAKYRVQQVHRNEMSFDWRSESDLSNCRWMLRERWVDKDEAEAHFPKHKKTIRMSLGQWSAYDMDSVFGAGDSLSQAYREYQYSTRDEKEWLLPHRDMVKVYELYYRVWTNGIVLRAPSGKAVVFNENNPVHIAMINSGRVSVEKRAVPSLRLSWYVGPHFITDMASPHPHNHYPYIPFIGAREDETRIPYGLVRSMLSPQDEINFRRIRLTGDLNYKRIIMDEDASKMHDDDLRQQVHQADGIVKLNPDARREGGGTFKVESDQGLSSQQFQVMQDAKTLIQDVAGIYNAFLGKEGGAQSGVAINSLVEQGATTLADINDNYNFARQMVGEICLAHEVNDMKEERNIQVVVPGRLGKPRKQIVLNAEGESGEINNDVAHAKTQVVLAEIQQTAGYRAQVSQMLMDFISKLPADFQTAGLGIVVEQLEIPEEKREELMKLVQKVTGDVNTDEMTEDELAEYQANQQKELQKQAVAEQTQMAAMQLELEELKKKIAKLAADTELTTSKSGTEKARAAQIAVETANANRRPPPPPTQMLQ